MRVIIVFCALLAVTFSRRSLPEYEINLDLPVAQRYAQVLRDLKEPAIAAMDQVFNHKLKLLLPTLRVIARLRGPEDPEMQEELAFFADAIQVPVLDIQIINWLAELGSIMIPDHIRKNPNIGEALELIGIPMCTGIVAYGPDGTVNHARNQDFVLPEYLSKILYTGIFTRGGKEIFRSQMYTGFAGTITAFKKGVIAVEVNTRYPQHLGGNVETLSNLILHRHQLGMWMIRKTMESAQTYDEALKALQNTPITAPIYFIVSGVKAGAILARDPNGVAHQITLGVDNSSYIVMTNFDYWNNDWREYFDPTANFQRRRIGVQKSLDGKKEITRELLFETINRPDVKAKDTLYQAIMNVELGYYDVSTPYDL